MRKATARRGAVVAIGKPAGAGANSLGPGRTWVKAAQQPVLTSAARKQQVPLANTQAAEKVGAQPADNVDTQSADKSDAQSVS